VEFQYFPGNQTFGAQITNKFYRNTLYWIVVLDTQTLEFT